MQNNRGGVFCTVSRLLKTPSKVRFDIAYWETICQTQKHNELSSGAVFQYNQLILHFYIFAG